MNKNIYAATAIGIAVGARAEEVEFSDLPKAARNTINQHLNGGVVREIDRQTIYEVEIQREGRNRHLRVDASGKLLSGGRDGGEGGARHVESGRDTGRATSDREFNAEVDLNADDGIAQFDLQIRFDVSIPSEISV